MIEDSFRQFVDTNVLVYAHDRTAGEKHDRAVALVDQLWANGTGCISTQVLKEFYVTVTQKIPTPLDAQVARQLIDDLSAWTVHQPNPSDILDAIDIQQSFQTSFWDALILLSASRLGCSILWSEDLNAGQVYGSIEVQNPFQ